MPALPATLAGLTVAHLQSLIDEEVTESVVLEFKSAPYGPDHDGAREFLKDVSALANTAGGLLLIGVKEEEGVASQILPIDLAEADKIKQRLESLMQSSIEPRLFGVEMRAVPTPGGCVIALRIAKSPLPPHRVTQKGSNKFYLRSSAGAYEASMDELRDLFLQAGAIRERVQAFRRERLAQLAENFGPVRLVEDANLLVLHILPVSALGASASIDLSKANSTMIPPIGASGWNYNYNFEGFVTLRGGQACHGYTQLLREGAIEATYAGVAGQFHGKLHIDVDGLAEKVERFAPSYIAALQALGVTPPIYVMASLLNVGGAYASTRAMRDWEVGETQPIPGDLLLPICLVDEFGPTESYIAALKLAFDALWNAAGIAARPATAD